MSELTTTVPEMFGSMLWAYYWFWFARGAAEFAMVMVSLGSAFLFGRYVIRAIHSKDKPNGR